MWRQYVSDVSRLDISHLLDFFAPRDVQVWSHVRCAISQLDLEIFISVYGLIFAKYRVCEVRLEGRDRGQATRRRRNEVDCKRFGDVARPCSMSAADDGRQYAVELTFIYVGHGITVCVDTELLECDGEYGWTFSRGSIGTVYSFEVQMRIVASPRVAHLHCASTVYELAQESIPSRD